MALPGQADLDPVTLHIADLHIVPGVGEHIYGVDSHVSHSFNPGRQGYRMLDLAEDGSLTSRVYWIENPAAAVWFPQIVIAKRSDPNFIDRSNGGRTDSGAKG